MTEGSYRLAFVCACCLIAACSSTPGQKDSGFDPVEVPPARGMDASIADGRDGGDSAKPGDGAAEAGDGAADLADASDGADRFETADVPVAPDVPVDLPVDKPTTNLANGAPCTAAAMCRSKFCVDGVCCDTACEGEDPNRCNACTMAKTGQKDGTCAPDRVRERMKCGEACGQLAMGVPAVFAMVCQGGRCMVPSVPTVVGDPCRKPGDMCTVSFCDQPTNRTARCVSTLCPQGGTCCCQMGDNVAQRSCMSTTACKNDRMCVSQ